MAVPVKSRDEWYYGTLYECPKCLTRVIVDISEHPVAPPAENVRAYRLWVQS
jgi:hypothetical protein